MVQAMTRQPNDNMIAPDVSQLRTLKLIQRIKAGDENAWTELFNYYRLQIGSLAYKFVGDYDEAEDIVQVVFIKLHRNLWRFDEKKKFYTWVHRMTVNASIDHLRKYKRHRHDSLDEALDVADVTSVSPEIGYARGRINDDIIRALEALNQKQRDAFILRDLEGLKFDAVASIMKIPEATVRWYLHRARLRLQKDLRKKCPQLLIQLNIC